ncbi:hypothetical protein CVIRNUC_002944 [Coccomyxa viridis]|uniref:Terpene cyclase/mutase family member n=1 Tax=Coccomyxa viridis TaxID=1274662 RepID=A0AAV1HY85_9CHLO|nr:hypothetical protein CVIRNUC_002944 [Coccomyxa viridis]
MWKLKSAEESKSSPLLRSLNDFQGRQIWAWDANAGSEQERAAIRKAQAQFSANRHDESHSADLLLRLQQTGSVEDQSKDRGFSAPIGVPSGANVTAAIRDGVDFYQQLQQADGHWPGDYGGPMFLMPGLVIALYVTGALEEVLSPQHQIEMLRYLRNHQNRDGGYGLHIEGQSTMFGTALSYVTMRILGLPAEDEVCAAAQKWIRANGGATHITSWGKFWLAVLGCYSWDGMNPTPPEIWLLPYATWTGIGLAHPGRFWCHCRMVYLPMSYVYGARGTGKLTPLVLSLRKELYCTNYDTVDWNAARNQCAPSDLYYPHPKVQDVLWWALYQLERPLLGSALRRKALAEVMRHVHYEDENTRYVCIGPVNKVINMLCCWLEDPNSEAFRRHIPRLYDFLWVAEDGMKMQGYNGSQLWDTTFAVQAICATGMAAEFTDCLQKAQHYVDVTQVREDCPGPLKGWYRHISKGAWPFSTRDHGWPISDCSSEGLKACLSLAEVDGGKLGSSVSKERLQDCVNVILSYQNGDGGWATYENTRSYSALELINPSETFGDIVIDYSYVECTSACMTSLADFQHKYPQHRAAEIANALRRGQAFIEKQQRRDGSWYGSWGVCFTYAAWFGCEALACVGKTVANSEGQLRACEFLLSKQCSDGGWGESYLSCQEKVYSQLRPEQSQVVHTAWAILALISAGYHYRATKQLQAAVRYLMSRQLPSGDWPQEHITGVFNRNCMITYANYRNIFPIWALGKYRTAVLKL